MTPDYSNKTQAGTEVGAAISAHFGVLSLFKFREANANYNGSNSPLTSGAGLSDQATIDGDLIVAAGPMSVARLDTQE